MHCTTLAQDGAVNILRGNMHCTSPWGCTLCGIKTRSNPPGHALLQHKASLDLYYMFSCSLHRCGLIVQNKGTASSSTCMEKPQGCQLAIWVFLFPLAASLDPSLMSVGG